MLFLERIDKRQHCKWNDRLILQCGQLGFNLIVGPSLGVGADFSAPGGHFKASRCCRAAAYQGHPEDGGYGNECADLKAGLKWHVIDTKNQIERLDKVFAKLGKQPKGTDCPAIDGLIKEANETAGEIEDKAVLDAAIVANSQAVEHYEISRYGTLIAWAEELGHEDVVRLLTTNLNEEKQPQHFLPDGVDGGDWLRAR
jgi:ferritin-like metal-binding protein YciE